MDKFSLCLVPIRPFTVKPNTTSRILTRLAYALALFVWLVTSAHLASAQSDEKKLEIGGQFSLLQIQTRSIDTVSLSPFFVTACCAAEHKTVFGFGGRFGYNISKHFELEGEVNLFPENDDLKGGRKIQGLFGVKAGKRFDKVGLFAKARPGFIRYEKGDYVFVQSCGTFLTFPPPGCFNPIAHTSFAVDLGGVVEVYPSKRTIIRFDAGDTIVRLPVRGVAVSSSSVATSTVFSVLTLPAETKNQLQMSVGFGWRF